MKARIRSKLDPGPRIALQDAIPLHTPLLLYVDPSSACNFRCRFCPTGHADLVQQAGYRRRVLDLAVFKKVIADLRDFDQPIRVLRLNKIGEPLLNKHVPEMISSAKASGRVELVDLATNGALLSRELWAQLVAAGLDRLNLSLEGMSREQYREVAGVDFDFEAFVADTEWFYENRGNCEFTIKVPGNHLSAEQREQFFATFGDRCDRIFIENIASIWPAFDVEERGQVAVDREQGQYGTPLAQKDTCTYIFYAAAINADGTVSACCPDWEQRLLVGDARATSLASIWHSKAMNDLRRQHLEGRRRENDVCRDCGHLAYAQVDDIDPYREALLTKFAEYERSALP